MSARLIGSFGLQKDRYYFIIIGSGCKEQGKDAVKYSDADSVEIVHLLAVGYFDRNLLSL